MARFFERVFGGAPPHPPHPAAVAMPDELDAEHVPVRYRPRLIAQLLDDHESARRAMRGVLDACLRRDEDRQILGLREVAAAVRRANLVKATQLYAYLGWGLESDRVAAIQLKAVRAEAGRAMQAAEAIFADYLGGPWLAEQRRRLVGDLAKAAQLLGGAMKQEEASVFPLYLPPGQYRYVGAARPA